MYKTKLNPKLSLISKIHFNPTPNPEKSLLSSLFKTYWFMVTYITLTVIFVTLIDFFIVYATKEVLTEIDSQISKHKKLTDRNKILYWFIGIWISGIITTLLNEWIWLQSCRFIFRLMGAAYSLIFMKMLKIGIVNSHEHDEGSIINYMQSDIQQFYFFSMALSGLTSGIINLVLSILLGLFYFKIRFLVLVAGLCILGLVNTILIFSAMGLQKKLQEKNDKRINVLKSFLKNLNFVKINGMENLFVRKVNQSRYEELKAGIKVHILWIFVEFIFVLGTPMTIVVFLYFYLETGGVINVANITILLRIFTLMESSLFALPGSLSTWADLLVSMKRIGLFLDSKELDFQKVRMKENINDFEAVGIENGCFYWDRKLTKEEAEEIRKGKLSAMKKVEKAEKEEIRKWKKDKKTYSEADSSILRQTLLTQYTSDSMKEKIENVENSEKFELNELNFSAKKGELTTIIGKTGSGKSTLLYSILGETMIKNYNKTKVKINGNICYCGQNPWLINGTVKENIILGKEFDKEKFDWAVKFSALELDLKNWDEKENHEIGEGGTALSGGQRTRVVLARCLYQE